GPLQPSTPAGPRRSGGQCRTGDGFDVTRPAEEGRASSGAGGPVRPHRRRRALPAQHDLPSDGTHQRGQARNRVISEISKNEGEASGNLPRLASRSSQGRERRSESNKVAARTPPKLSTADL